jgi:hypothetical protein
MVMLKDWKFHVSQLVLHFLILLNMWNDQIISMHHYSAGFLSYGFLLTLQYRLFDVM